MELLHVLLRPPPPPADEAAGTANASSMLPSGRLMYRFHDSGTLHRNVKRVRFNMKAARSRGGAGAGSRTERTIWKARKSCCWAWSSIAASAAALKRTNAAADSNKKWLKPGWVGFLHTCSSMSTRSFSAVGATGAICGASPARWPPAALADADS